METKKTLLKLSFSGSKINRVREIEQLIENKNYKRVVEVFGCSCCISNNLKRDNIIQEAIANDYDQYFHDFDKKMEFKDKLIEELTQLGFVKRPATGALPDKQMKQLQQLIAPAMADKKLILYLSKNFVFSARRSAGIINIADFCYFMNELSTHHDREYCKELKKIQLDSLDYKDFIKKYIQPNDKDTLIILDPPYLNSNQKQYNNEVFFGLCETIRLLNIMKQLKNDFIFFNQVKNDSIELLNLFEFNYIHKTKVVSMSGNNHREDFMSYITFDSQNKIFNPCLNVL